jgi:membrane associated rhomboid family serine protease
MIKKGFFSSYTGILIAINVFVFIVALIFSYNNPNFIKYLALQPSQILEGKTLWTFATSMFMHAGLGHIFANMVSLIFIGGLVEKILGKKRFLGLYIIGGLVASLFFVILAGFFGNTDIGARIFGSPLSYAVGASGAIFALGGLLAVITPRLRVLMFFIIPMPMWVAMLIFSFAIWLLSISLSLPIGNTAHLGGLVVGVIYGLYLKKKYPKKTAMIAKYFGG